MCIELDSRHSFVMPRELPRGLPYRLGAQLRREMASACPVAPGHRYGVADGLHIVLTSAILNVYMPPAVFCFLLPLATLKLRFAAVCLRSRAYLTL